MMTFKQTKIGLLSLFIVLLSTAALSASDSIDLVRNNGLVIETKAAQRQSETQNTKRESGFADTEQALQAQLDALNVKQKSLESETEQLSDSFSQNEQSLVQLEETLRLETGSLGELFGVLRQASRELQTERINAPASIDQTEYDDALADILDAKTLPSLSTLNIVWHGMQQELANGSVIAPITVNVRDVDGVITSQTVERMGNVALVNQDGYLTWDSTRKQANLLPVQPKNGVTSATLGYASSEQWVLLDPTRGSVLEQLAYTPTLSDRFAQGGLIGKIIAVLLIVGLIISAVRGITLLRIRIAIRTQMKHPDVAGDNPLGRILSVYQSAPNRSLESLELHLLEAIVDEQQGFEKGLSMLKLLAALAPMLGLLGTVTGMIETFQVITQYGNGDPTVMAGGISMALVTTVMGLVAAIPLLLAHNLLSSQAETLRGTLEKISISLVAQQSDEMESSVIPRAMT